MLSIVRHEVSQFVHASPSRQRAVNDERCAGRPQRARSHTSSGSAVVAAVAGVSRQEEAGWGWEILGEEQQRKPEPGCQPEPVSQPEPERVSPARAARGGQPEPVCQSQPASFRISQRMGQMQAAAKTPPGGVGSQGGFPEMNATMYMHTYPHKWMHTNTGTQTRGRGSLFFCTHIQTKERQMQPSRTPTGSASWADCALRSLEARENSAG